MAAESYTPSVQTTFLPKVAKPCEPIISRRTENNAKGRVYRFDGTTGVSVVSA